MLPDLRFKNPDDQMPAEIPKNPFFFSFVFAVFASFNQEPLIQSGLL